MENLQTGVHAGRQSWPNPCKLASQITISALYHAALRSIGETEAGTS